MSKSILVYFKSENDAETARSGLQRLRVSDLYVDHLPEGDTKQTFVPISAAHSPGTEESGMVKEKGVLAGLFNKKEDPATHLIQAQVQEVDYEAAIDVLIEANGFTEK